MKATVTPKPKLDYDPYEEDCCGAHPGETTTVECDDPLKIIIREQRSGIGSEYYIDVDAGKYGTETNALVVYIGDDGILYVGPRQ